MKSTYLLSAFVLATFSNIANAAPTAVKERTASPQHFAFEFKLGPYSPNMDAEFDGSTPMGDMFGDGSSLSPRIEFDLQLWHGFGSIGVGASFGYYSADAAACLDDAEDGGVATCSDENRVAGDRTSLTLLPLALLAVYRLDVIADRLGVPLVPYAKFGFNYTFWWMEDGNGAVSKYVTDDATQRARGGVLGWQFNLGIGVRLDRADPGAANTLDADYGINHSYLFVELLHVQTLDEPRFDDTTYMTGLALEF